MASLREVGEHVALVLSVYDGKDFIPSDSQEGLKIVVGLDGRETLESEVISDYNETPDFNVELVWTMSRATFQALRSRKVPLKLQVYKIPRITPNSPNIIGTFLFDLRESFVLSSNAGHDPNESYINHASWKKLISTDLPAGRVAPSLMAALVIEPNLQKEDDNEEDKTEHQMDEDLKSQVAESVPSTKRLTPVLQNEKGYFSIGPEDAATNIYYFNIFICFGNFVQQAFPKDVKIQENDELKFVYDIFGTQISSKPFSWSKIKDFKPERATAKIYTSPQKLIEFFQKKMQTYCIFVCNDSNHLALAEVNLFEKLQLNIQDLLREKTFVYEGTIDLEPVKRYPEESSNMTMNKTASSVEQPHIGVRFSIGTSPDEGLDFVSNHDNLEKEVTSESQQASQKLWTPLPSKAKFKDESSLSQDCIEFDTTDFLNEPVQKYKFCIDLKQIELCKKSEKPIEVTIKYKYKHFCATEVSTQAFNLQQETLEIPRGYCEYSFSAKESAIRKPLEKYPLILKVCQQDNNQIVIGSATVDLSVLFSTRATRSMDSRHVNLQAPITRQNSTLTNDLIGYLECQFTLKDLGMIANSNLISSSHKSAFNPVFKKPEAKEAEAEDVDKVALEVEEWKQKQKKTFRNQLQNLESQHIQTLSTEWEKREKERENILHDKMSEILVMEKELRKAIEDHRSKQKDLKSYEEDLHSREKKLDEREDRLQKLLASSNRSKNATSTGKLQDQVKDLLKENETLKTQLSTLRAKNEGLKVVNDQIGVMKKELNSLRQFKSTHQEKMEELERNTSFHQKARHEAENQVRQLQIERDKNLANQLDLYRSENQKLKVDHDKLRNDYDKMVQFQFLSTKNQSNKKNSYHPEPMEESEETQSEVTVIDANVHNEIVRLKKQKELFLNTKVYNENDALVKMIDAKIQSLCQKAE